jgi:hypothetical protein
MLRSWPETHWPSALKVAASMSRLRLATSLPFRNVDALLVQVLQRLGKIHGFVGLLIPFRLVVVVLERAVAAQTRDPASN